MAKGYQRKKQNYFIKKDMQGRLTWQFFLLTLFCILLFCAIFAVFSADQVSISYDGQQVQVGSFPAVMAKEILQNNWIFLIVGGLLIVVISIILSHKIAGPIYHFETVTRNMCERNLNQQITLRSRDDAQELAASLNRFNRTLSGDIRGMLGKSAEIKAALQSNDLQKVEQVNQKLQETLSAYRLLEEQDNS